MRRWWLVGGICLVVLFAAGAWWLHAHAPQQTIASYPSKGTDVIAIGDSLVYGTGATKGHDIVSDLSQAVGIKIINLGHPGDTTADTLARLNELDAYHPKVVIVLVGGNDYLQKLSMEQAFVNLGEIVANIQARGAVALVVGLRISPEVGNFDPEFNALVAQYHTAYVPDVLDGIWGNPQYLSDQIHPNDTGYALMASRIAPVLKPLLQ